MPVFVSSVRGIEPIRYCFDSASSASVGPSAAIRDELRVDRRDRPLDVRRVDAGADRSAARG